MWNTDKLSCKTPLPFLINDSLIKGAGLDLAQFISSFLHFSSVSQYDYHHHFLFFGSTYHIFFFKRCVVELLWGLEEESYISFGIILHGKVIHSYSFVIYEK